MITISISGRDGQCKQQASGIGSAELYYQGYYEAGDVIRLTMDEGEHVWFQGDQAMNAAKLYLPSRALTFRIPTGEARCAYPPQAFSGYRHLISARTAEASGAYRNLALNPADQRGSTAAYPHVSANAETRGESVFEARNVIDGIGLNTSHGEWPFQSWGVDIEENACITLEFGRAVRIDKMALIIRADFPHDSYWTECTVELSDGTQMIVPLVKTADRQWQPLGEHTVEWLRISHLVKAEDDPSPFPALVEWEVYGWER